MLVVRPTSVCHALSQTEGQTDVTTNLHIASFTYIGRWRHNYVTVTYLSQLNITAREQLAENS